jgi:S-adenosyl-L-methionine hydrolase (adenosine-forming)
MTILKEAGKIQEMKNPNPIILMTDFGGTDPFVGIMKGVIHRIAPEAATIDLTHEIPPGNVLRGAVTLWQSAAFFPPGAIFLAVVDPGVGSTRKPAVFKARLKNDEQACLFVGPDNGLFTFLLKENAEAWEIRKQEYILPDPSRTFHGRDIFAPAAAHLWNGVQPVELGPALQQPVRLPNPRLFSKQEHEIHGEVLFSDRFGNVLTSLGRFSREDSDNLRMSPWLPGVPETSFIQSRTYLSLPDGTRLPFYSSYEEIPPGKCAVVVGSSSLLEIAANRKSAAEILKLSPGAPLTIVED